MSDMDPQACLQAAQRAIFSLGLHDAAAALCEANMAYGLAKVNHVLKHFGHRPDALFVGTPDMTITRNSARWSAGFGYGGKLLWGAGDRPLVVLDAKPNVCGMLVGAIEKLPQVDDLIHRVHQLQHRGMAIQDVAVEWDLHKGNHFIDLCALQPADPAVELPPSAFVIHTAAPEMRGPNPLGPGLYWDASDQLAAQYREIDTPWGPLHVLINEHAVEFYRFYELADSFAKQRRLMIAQALFGEFQLIANVTHQGMSDMNTVYLGCHNSLDPDADYLPIMVRGDLPGYLFEGLPNLSDSVIRQMDFYDRANDLGLLEALRNANVIPHGAGYALPHFRDVVRVIDLGDHRYFEMSVAPATTNEAAAHVADGTEVLTDTHDLPQKYRGRQGVFKTIECGLGRLVAKLTPLHVVKV